MAVSQSFLDFVVDQLGRITVITTKRMFGGVGVYGDGLFFALMAGDTLYFKVDDSNRKDFEEAGMEPFKPYDNDSHVMQYYEVPGEVLEDVDVLRPWVERATEVARSKKKKGRKR